MGWELSRWIRLHIVLRRSHLVDSAHTSLAARDTIQSALPVQKGDQSRAVFAVTVKTRTSSLLGIDPNRSRSREANWSSLQILYASLASVQVAVVALWAEPSSIKTRLSVANAVIVLVGCVASGLISYIEHQRTIRPSIILNIYLFLTLLLDITRVRTLWLQPYNNTLAAVTTVWVAVKVVVIVVEAIEKHGVLRTKFAEGASPEATCGFYGRAFFWWENSMFRQGYSTNLSVEGLYPLDKHLTASYLYNKLQGAWDRVLNKGHRSLLIMVFKKLGWDILYAVPPRLVFVAFQFCQPFLVHQAVSISEEPITTETTNSGYGLIGAYFIVYTGIAISSGQYQHMTYRAITMARGGLVAMLFSKSPSLETTAVDPASAMTLMSADIERIWNGWQTMHEIWANSLEVAIAIYLLYLQLGSACALPIAVAVVSFIGSAFVLNLVIARQALWLQAMERRISATTQMLGGMKRIKMCGLSQTLFDNIQGLRVDELQISKKFRKLLIMNMFFAFTTQAFAPVLSFTVFTLLALRDADGNFLDTNTAFTSLSLFALLAEPLASLIMALTQFVGSIGCFDRIQAFLESPEHIDDRVKPFMETIDKGNSSQTTDTSSSFVRDEKPMNEKTFSNSIMRRALMSSGSGGPGDALSVEDANFGWDKEVDAVLKDISLRVPQGKMTMIVGPVGCGKTTLLKAILGEVPRIAGKVKIYTGDVSYCDQSPFHMNGSVRDSITTFADFDERWYNTIVDACALDEDLRQMPHGDATKIGSKGVALSGGQCQRLALARAIYARTELCILDDVFSGLDLDTENRIFHKLLGLDGLLRRQCTTTVVASSSFRRLPFADHIVVLNENGKVSEQGSYKELVAAGGYISGLDLPPAEWSANRKEFKLDYLVSSANKPAPQPQATLPTIEDESELEANRRTGDISIYLYYAAAVGRVAVLIFAFAISGYVFCIQFPQVWLAWWTSYNVNHPNGNLGYWLGIYAMLAVAGMACLVVSCWSIIITMVPRSGERFHWQLLKTVLAAPMSFFSATDTGITLNRFSQDLQLIDMELPIAALNFFTVLVLCIAQITFIAFASKYAAVSFPLWFLALYLIQKFYLRTSRQLRFLDIEAKAPLYTQFSETLAGLTTVRAFGWQRALVKKNRWLLDMSQRPFYLLFAAQRWLQLVLDLVVAAVATMLMVLVVELRGQISGAYVGIAMLNVILFSQHLKLLLQYWTMLETHIGAITRVKNFVKCTPPEEEDPEKKATVSPSWPEQGAVEFKSVSASYDSSRMVLKDLNMNVEPGQKIGICGRTGSGKSSMVMAIFAMIELQGGSITIDGVDTSTIPRQEIRSRIIGLPQDVFLLSGSVRLNVDPYMRASDSDIINALEDVRLWKAIKEKGGLDADMDAVQLSHGQRQLLCLAQALLRPGTILVLDEATSR